MAFGRIGRLALRIGLLKHSDEIEFTAINTSGSMPTSGWAHLTNYDTMYRQFELKVQRRTKAVEELTEGDYRLVI
jgi:glyceraldehyde-3-phosphate dehydrogenase/erythrose-4-phosphate dehydrogenase